MESDVVSDTHADGKSLTDARATLPIAEVINGDIRSSRMRAALDDRRPRATRRRGQRRSGCAHTRTQACHAISDGGLAQRSCRSSSGSVPMRDQPCQPIAQMIWSAGVMVRDVVSVVVRIFLCCSPSAHTGLHRPDRVAGQTRTPIIQAGSPPQSDCRLTTSGCRQGARPVVAQLWRGRVGGFMDEAKARA